MPAVAAPHKGPKTRWLTGNLAEFRADRLAFFTRVRQDLRRRRSPALLNHRILLLSRPDLIEEVLISHSKQFIKHFGLRLYKPLLGDGLVTAEGEHWRRQRKLSAPAFQPGASPAIPRRWSRPPPECSTPGGTTPSATFTRRCRS